MPDPRWIRDRLRARRSSGASDRTDPLDVLAQPAPPLAPRPDFAAELRRRLEVALDRVPVPQTTPASTRSRGATMTDTAPTTPAVSHVPLGYVAVT
ncbi:hypothetical protein B7486_75355, partial [cyanobacterium TDX16]